MEFVRLREVKVPPSSSYRSSFLDRRPKIGLLSGDWAQSPQFLRLYLK